MRELYEPERQRLTEAWQKAFNIGHDWQEKSKAQEAELARYRSLAQVLVDALEKELQRGLLECEDGYYSCASHPNYFGPIDDGECDCGKAERDERINTALAKAKEDFDLTPTNQ